MSTGEVKSEIEGAIAMAQKAGAILGAAVTEVEQALSRVANTTKSSSHPHLQALQEQWTAASRELTEAQEAITQGIAAGKSYLGRI